MTIQTTRGPMDVSLLEKKEYAWPGSWVTEYYYNGELVHRSVAARLTGVQVEITGLA